MNMDKYIEMQLDIDNIMHFCPREFSTEVRFMYYFLLHKAILNNKITWQDEYFKYILNYDDELLNKCKEMLLTFGFINEKRVYSKKDKKFIVYYEIFHLVGYGKNV